MIKGLRILILDKLAFCENNGILRQIGKPMDILKKIPKEIKFLHLVDLNAKKGNMTNFDLYDAMTYSINIEVEIAAKEKLIKKLIGTKARVVLDLPCKIKLEKFRENKKLLVGKTNGKEKCEDVFDYYIETGDLKTIKEFAKHGKRIFLYSKTINEKNADNAGVFALIKDIPLHLENPVGIFWSL